jgi:hypothetical protein
VTGANVARRDFLRLAAGGAALLATGAGCNSGSEPAKSKATTAASEGKQTLRIAKRTNYIFGYDEWWDTQARRWGERNGIDVLVEHFDVNQLQAHAASEVASKRGHGRGGPGEIREHDPLRGAQHRESQDGKVLRRLRLLESQPRPLPQ